MQNPIDDSIDIIAKEIGLDYSYLTSDSDLHFDPITVTFAVALVLLKWFLEGVADELQDKLRASGQNAAARLARALTRVTARDQVPTDAEVGAAAHSASAASTNRSPPEIEQGLGLYEHNLITYFVDQGMPLEVARRIASRVRAEAERQVSLSAD